MNYVSAEELIEKGFTPCNDADLSSKVSDIYDNTHIVLMDENREPQLFARHGNDYFIHVKPIKKLETVSWYDLLPKQEEFIDELKFEMADLQRQLELHNEGVIVWLNH